MTAGGEGAARDRASSPGSTWIGTVLRDGWRIDAKIARGGVATVFRASKASGERAAVKILHPELARNEDVRNRFLQEGYAANTVGHPGVVRVLANAVADDGSAYLVMELLEGVLLEDKRTEAGGTLPLHEVHAITDQLLDVLAAAHEKGIVHRDVKPENLFLERDGTLKVLDFGIAHMKQTAIPRDATATGLLLGTPDYMAPEQAAGTRGQIDAQTDIWATGATMFMLLSGKSVHDASSVTTLLVAAASRPARSLGSVAKGVPSPVVAVVDRALAFEKHRRWPSARAMKEALGEAVGRVSSSASSTVTEKKDEQIPAPDSDPTGEVLPDADPWDDDSSAAERTVAEAPSFEIPSNIPSPISNAPPPMSAPKPAAAPHVMGLPRPAVPASSAVVTALGLGPDDLDLETAAAAAIPPPAVSPPKGPPPPAPRPGSVGRAPPMPARPRPPAPAPAAGAPPHPPPARPAPPAPNTPPPAAAAPDDDLGPDDDGPTMAVPAPVAHLDEPVPSARRRSPLASTGYSPSPASPTHDRDADTAAFPQDDDSDESTRAVPREEMLRAPDAQVIVGADAMGDEATLAVMPGGVALGRGSIAEALAETLQHREEPSAPGLGPGPGEPPARPDAPPAFPAPPPGPFHGNPMSSGRMHAAQPQAAQPQAAPGWGGGPPGYAHGAPPAPYPSSGHQVAHGAPPMNPMGPQGMPMQGQPQARAWMPQPAPPPAGTTRPKITPQVLLLVGVGAVCLAIFVIGVVLFVTTKF